MRIWVDEKKGDENEDKEKEKKGKFSHQSNSQHPLDFHHDYHYWTWKSYSQLNVEIKKKLIRYKNWWSVFFIGVDKKKKRENSKKKESLSRGL